MSRAATTSRADAAGRRAASAWAATQPETAMDYFRRCWVLHSWLTESAEEIGAPALAELAERLENLNERSER